MEWLNDVGDLLEGVTMESAILLAKSENAIASNAGELTEKLTFDVAIKVPACAAVEEGGKGVLHIVVAAFLKHANSIFKVTNEGFENTFATDVFADNLT